jgi:hypothetical protein
MNLSNIGNTIGQPESIFSPPKTKGKNDQIMKKNLYNQLNKSTNNAYEQD